MQASRIRGAIACAWIAGFVFLAGYASQSNPTYTLDLQEQSSNLFYVFAYVALVATIYCFYLIHQGRKATPKIWWSRLLIAHVAVLLLWIPVHIRSITKRMDQAVENLGQGLGAEQVFVEHPVIAVSVLKRIYTDESHSNDARWNAGDLLDILQGRKLDTCEALCCRGWLMRRHFEPPPPREF